MTRAARLRRSIDIAAVRKAGTFLRRDAFTARIRRTGGREIRIAMAGSRSLGTAVRRNRARRRVREAFRVATAFHRADVGLDMVLTPRVDALSAPFLKLRDDAASVLSEATL
jgi:ribonuclease P protein component